MPRQSGGAREDGHRAQQQQASRGHGGRAGRERDVWAHGRAPRPKRTVFGFSPT